MRSLRSRFASSFVLLAVIGCGSSDSGGGGPSGATGGSANGGFVGTGGTTLGGSGGVVVGSTGGFGNSSSGGTGNVVGTGGVPPGTGGAITSTGGTPGGCSPADQANACNGRVCGRDPVCGVLCGTCPVATDVCQNGQCVAGCVGTQTDPNNCGTCGHKCRGTCTGGKCDPALIPCFPKASGLTTCAQACGNETCVANGCTALNVTLLTYSTDVCTNGSVAPNVGCSDPIPWTSQDGAQCCCTDAR